MLPTRLLAAPANAARQRRKSAHRRQAQRDLRPARRPHGDHGVHFVRAVAQLAQVADQPFVEELADRIAGIAMVGRKGPEGAVDQRRHG